MICRWKAGGGEWGSTAPSSFPAGRHKGLAYEINSRCICICVLLEVCMRTIRPAQLAPITAAVAGQQQQQGTSHAQAACSLLEHLTHLVQCFEAYYTPTSSTVD